MVASSSKILLPSGLWETHLRTLPYIKSTTVPSSNRDEFACSDLPGKGGRFLCCAYPGLYNCNVVLFIVMLNGLFLSSHLQAKAMEWGLKPLVLPFNHAVVSKLFGQRATSSTWNSVEG